MAKPRKPAAKDRRRADSKVSVESDYDEASLLVVAANVLFGAMPDRETQQSLDGLLGKLYKAEPRLKVDARRIEGEMRRFLGPDGMAVDDGDDEGPRVHGSGYIEPILAAIEDGRALSLLREDGLIGLWPTGFGQIGEVAVAIGWSTAHEDYTLVRLDEIIGIGLETPSERPAATDPAKATLARLCRKPPTRGSLL